MTWVKIPREGTMLTDLDSVFSVQQRVTASFRQRDGRVLHVRKATVAEPALAKLCNAMEIGPTPGSVRKHTV